MVGIYEQNPKTVSALRLSLDSWDEAIKFVGTEARAEIVESRPTLKITGLGDYVRIGDWIVLEEDASVVAGFKLICVVDSVFRSNYKRRIPRKAKDDAASAAKKKVKAA